MAEFSITSGKLRGQGLASPRSKVTHPMSARARLALFNSLGNIEGTRVLDAFAGTGALGLEALSRGAASAVFVDNNADSIKCIKENARALGVYEQVAIYKSSAEKFAGLEDGKYDIIFADPPYDKYNRIDLNVLNKLANLATDRFVLSHPSSFDPSSIDARLVSTRKYAEANISIYH